MKLIQKKTQICNLRKDGKINNPGYILSKKEYKMSKVYKSKNKKEASLK